MWSPRQARHLPHVWDHSLSLALAPDGRDQRLCTERHGQCGVNKFFEGAPLGFEHVTFGSPVASSNDLAIALHVSFLVSCLRAHMYVCNSFLSIHDTFITGLQHSISNAFDHFSSSQLLVLLGIAMPSPLSPVSPACISVSLLAIPLRLGPHKSITYRKRHLSA